MCLVSMGEKACSLITRRPLKILCMFFFTAELYSLIPSTRCHYYRSGSRIFICEKKDG